MIELVKRYKGIIIIGVILILNIGAIVLQSQPSQRIQLDSQQDSKMQDSKKADTGHSISKEQLISSNQSSTTNSQLIDSNEAITTRGEPIALIKEEALGSQLVNSNKAIITSSTPQALEEAAALASQNQTTTQKVPVYICGAVRVPGVYYLTENAIIDDVLKLCGGFLEEADTTAINLASPIVANERIIVPKQGEVIQNTISPDVHTSVVQRTDAPLPQQTAQNTLININRASASELITLPGIGEVKAQAIISYRETVKQFSSIEEIKNISGIGEKTFDKLKSLITV